MSRTLVHYYFTTRQELLRAAFAYAENLRIEALEAELATLATGAERAERALLRTIDPELEETPALWNEVWSSLRYDEELRPLVQERYRAWVERIVRLLEEGREDGSVPRSVDPPEQGGASPPQPTGSTRSSISACSIATPPACCSPRASIRELEPVRRRSQSVVLEGVSKTFDDVAAVDDVSLEVGSGEFFSLLGPSGCGKTTTLRMIAGFERPDAGRIVIGDADVTETPPHLRPVNTVFQSYALFPHLSVEQNVGFGLRFTDVSKDERRGRGREALELVRLGGLGAAPAAPALGRPAAARRAGARARALAGGAPPRRAARRARREAPPRAPGRAQEHPARDRHHVPLRHARPGGGADDVRPSRGHGAAARSSSSARRVTCTSDPETAFVADFLGVSNLMRARVLDGRRVDVGGVTLERRARRGSTAPAWFVSTIRPERVRIEPPATHGENRVPATIERFVYLGSTTQVFVALPGGDRVQALVANSGDVDEYDVGAAVTAHLPADALRILADDEAVTA